MIIFVIITQNDHDNDEKLIKIDKYFVAYKS